VPPEKTGNTILQYFSRRSTDSSPNSEAAYAPDTPSAMATPVRPDTPPIEGVTPRRWFHTAAGEWIDLSKLGPVDWGAVSDKFSNMLTARPRCEPPADIYLKDNYARPGEDTSWCPTGDESATATGETEFVEHCSPEFVDHADDHHPTEYELSSAQLNTPLAYDWRTDAGRAMVRYGRPRDGDTYTRDGNTFHTVGGPPIMQPIELLTRWLDQLPGQLGGANASPS